jgi:hypothetical protein
MKFSKEKFAFNTNKDESSGIFSEDFVIVESESVRFEKAI